MSSPGREIRRFGPFELDLDAAEVRQNGLRVRLQPQPFKLLVLLTSRPGSLIKREEIRSELWPEGTFVDFDQSVNFAVKQIRVAFGDSASHPIYLETVPRQGYRFVAPVTTGASAGPAPPRPAPPPIASDTVRLQKAMWANIAELRQAEVRQRKQMRWSIAALVVVLLALVLYVLLR